MRRIVDETCELRYGRWKEACYPRLDTVETDDSLIDLEPSLALKRLSDGAREIDRRPVKRRPGRQDWPAEGKSVRRVMYG